MSDQNQSRKAFTLIELLVVISIIAMLMSIMMPALGRARENAKSVICRSNLKQIYLGASLWSDDNDGYTVAAFWSSPATSPGKEYASLDPYLNSSSEQANDCYRCPSVNTVNKWMEEMKVWVAEDVKDRLSYGANAYLYLNQVGPDGRYPACSCKPEGSSVFGPDDIYAYRHGWAKIASLKNANRLMYFMDYGYYHFTGEIGFDPSKPVSELDWNVATRWHGKKDDLGYGYSNMAWLDGHVSVEPDDFADIPDDDDHRYPKYWYYINGLK